MGVGWSTQEGGPAMCSASHSAFARHQPRACAPSEASSSTIAAPIPDVPPVTMTLRPARPKRRMAASAGELLLVLVDAIFAGWVGGHRCAPARLPA